MVSSQSISESTNQALNPFQDIQIPVPISRANAVIQTTAQMNDQENLNMLVIMFNSRHNLRTSFLCQSQVCGERRMRHPFSRVSRRGLFQHAIDLLQRQAFGLGDQEIRVHKTDGTQRSPDKKDARTKVGIVTIRADHVRCDHGDDLRSVSACVVDKRSLLRTQFQNQFEAVEIATPRERMGRGKISPITTHAP